MIKKYSQLHISKATKEQINSVSKKLGLTPEQVVAYAHEVDPTEKYEVWLLKQMGFKNIILPEDADRVKKTLKQFEQLNHRKQLKFQNINQYKSIMDLENEIDSLLPKELSDAYSYDVQEFLKLPGVSVYGQNNEWFILKVTDPESLTILGDSTEWCTRHIDMAKRYLEGTSQYVVFKKQNGKLIKYAQFEEDFSQFKNVKDHEIQKVPSSLYDLATSKLEPPWSFVKRNPSKMFDYLDKHKQVYGNLFLGESGLKALPENLTIFGGLEISSSEIEILPQGLNITDFLHIDHCVNLTTIPSNLKVKGDLYINRCPELKEIPSTITVGKNMSLIDCGVESLPDGLTIGGDLTIIGKFNQFPSKINVGGNLILGGTQIAELPDNLVVSGSLNIGWTPLEKLPAGLIVSDDLYLDRTNIKELPLDLKVGGNLDVSSSKIESIPANPDVKGYVILNNCQNLTSLPENLKINGSLFLEKCENLQELPENMEVKSLFLTGCKKITQLPKSLVVKGIIVGFNPLTKKPYSEEYERNQKEKEMVKSAFLRKLNVK
jgi:hypothetical protein